MSLSRVLVTTKVTLTHQFSPDEIPTDAGGSVTYLVSRLDGTQVVTGTAADIGAGLYSFELPASASLDTWTVDWTGSWGGATVTVRDIVEIVGGFLFELGYARERKRLSTVHTTAKLAQQRILVEDEAERVGGCAFVPRFRRLLLDGTGTSEITTPDLALRTVRAAKVAPRAGGTFVAFTAAELAAVAALPEGVLVRDDGGLWPAGHRNVIVEYEYGLDAAPAGVRDAAVERLAHQLGRPDTAIPDRAISYTIADGGVYRLGQAGKVSTGYPEIDAAYKGAGFGEKVWMAG